MVLSLALANHQVSLLLFFVPGTQFPGNEKITLCNTKSAKNHAGMNLTPPRPSENCHVVRWHFTPNYYYYYYFF